MYPIPPPKGAAPLGGFRTIFDFLPWWQLYNKGRMRSFLTPLERMLIFLEQLN